MDMPKAEVRHHSPGRVRVAVPARRGDAAYFERAASALATAKGEVVSNPFTGTLLWTGEDVELARIKAAAEKRGLFHLPHEPKDEEVAKPVLSRTLSHGIGGLSRKIYELSGGRMNLNTLLIVILLAQGVKDVLHGKSGLPSWHSSFWYAFSLVTMTMAQQKDDGKGEGVMLEP